MIQTVSDICQVLKMTEDLESIAEKILSSLDIRPFPDGYIEDGGKLAEFDLPKGDEVMMYRELEGVFVMFGYERIFFKDPYEAKYVYYCAKRGMSRIRMPETKPLKRIIKEFQADVENLRAQLEKEAAMFSLNDDERSRLVEICAGKLGYDGIMDI
ncbi:hypothetical protein IX51_01620 [uncultured archaeon]|nr:hypothetical protein IX51_01620 [uncultured archaeon]